MRNCSFGVKSVFCIRFPCSWFLNQEAGRMYLVAKGAEWLECSEEPG